MKDDQGETRETILVVEDDKSLKDLIITILKRSGYEAIGFAYGSEALKHISDRPPDALIIDQKLPDMSGRDLLAILAEKGLKVPFMIITGQGNERLAVEMMKLGANDYLVKDIDFLDILPVAVERLFSAIYKEQALQKSQQTLDALMEHIPIGISIADSIDFRLQRVSHYGLELMGWPKEKHEGWTIEEILSQWEVYNADGLSPVDFMELPLTKAITKGEKVFGQELVQRHTDGRAVPLICDAGPIRDANGNITGGIVAWQDTTERKKTEEALKLQSRERAAVDTFTYSVSNDLQAPLRRIEGFSEALLEECSDQLDDQARDYLNTYQ